MRTKALRERNENHDNKTTMDDAQAADYASFQSNLANLYTPYEDDDDDAEQAVTHLEPWERGTRKVVGLTGMCGGVRGVGSGGVVSSAYCLLYRLHQLRVQRKQLCTMINHPQSPYIRGMAFLFIRYTQPPKDLWSWYWPYLDDHDQIDPRSGGGDIMTFGTLVKGMLTKLDWYGTLFPRIPVPIQVRVCACLCKFMLITSLQKEIEDHLAEYNSGGVEAAMGMSGGNRQERYRQLEQRRNRQNDAGQMDEQQPDDYQNQRRQERKRNAGELGGEGETWPTLPATAGSAPNATSTRQLRRRPVYGLIFLFKWRPGDEISGTLVADDRNDRIFFAQQDRGLALSNTEAIRQTHNSFARPTVFEFDEQHRTDKDDDFHFVTYVPVDGRVYELDGLLEAPVDLGRIEPGTDWLDTARPLIQKRIQKSV
ncbi:unnamed protein product [Sphagnum balticum]